MKKRTKSTRAAWKEIRAAFQFYADTGRLARLSVYGVCNAIALIEGISWRQGDAMMQTLKHHKPKKSGDFFWKQTRAGARRRVKMIDKILKSL